jgi:predicted alpha/beta hydrolase
MRDSKVKIELKRIGLESTDGLTIAGQIFLPPKPRQSPIAVLIVGGAGIPARAYRHFAAFLANKGVIALTFDYRGIGDSRPEKLRGYVATAADWSEYDCGGAINYLTRHYPDAKVHAVAHSIGGFLLGGAINSNMVSRIVLVGAHSGYLADYKRSSLGPMVLLWHAAMPVLTHLVGYFPARALGLGEDLPAGLALQWAARRTPDFRPNKKGKEFEREKAMLERHAGLKASALALIFEDDPFGTPSGLRRLLSIYPQLTVRIEEISPDIAEMAKIGHYGFFRPNAADILWPKVLRFLTQGESIAGRLA